LSEWVGKNDLNLIQVFKQMCDDVYSLFISKSLKKLSCLFPQNQRTIKIIQTQVEKMQPLSIFTSKGRKSHFFIS
jgi:hypothetical protein